MKRRCLLSACVLLSHIACSSDDTTEPGPTPADAGVETPDTGLIDSGVEAPDAGFVDAGPPRDGGHYCAENNAIEVAGQPVSVDPASERPVASSGNNAVTSCIDQPPSDNPAFITDYCITECVDFMGYDPTLAEVNALEIHAFLMQADGNAVDPTYDFETYRERTPDQVRNVGYRFVSTEERICSSGWQIEIGFLNLGGGSFDSETRYILRVRTSSNASATWPTTYHYNFIRRNDQVPGVSGCGLNEQRIPNRSFDFPIISAQMLQTGAALAANPIPGTDDLSDGLGAGHAIIEARDCSGGGGVLMTRATGGFGPAPAVKTYLDETFALSESLMQTSAVGRLLGVGFPGNTDTTSTSVDVGFALGLTTDGTCTEGFGGLVVPVHADSVTYLRMNRETVIFGR